MREQYNIEDCIPQRPPFVFIDTIEEVGESYVRTTFSVKKNCVLLDDESLSIAGLMENAAQTCAARGGKRIGYIGAVKQIEATRLPKIGEQLTTEARVIEEIANISLMEIVTFVDEQPIATTTLKIAIME